MPAVSELIKQHDVVVFSWVHCPFCVKVKEILKPLTKDMQVYDIDTMEGGDDMKKEIETTYSHDTVPAVFIRGKFVGGCSDVQELQKQQQLVPMINGSQ